MDIEKVNAMIASLISKRQSIQDDINKERQAILGIQENIASMEEDIQGIDEDIAQIKLRAEKQKEKEQAKKDAMEKKAPEPLEVEEEVAGGDAATTTGSLSAASVSHGGDFGGWRHYSKMGEVQKRSTPKKKKKKKKAKKRRVVEFVDSVFESIENGE